VPQDIVASEAVRSERFWGRNGIQCRCLRCLVRPRPRGLPEMQPTMAKVRRPCAAPSGSFLHKPTI
jgi:hypothetical protein